MLDTGGRVAGDEFASLPALLEFGKCLEKVGLGMVDMLSSMKEGFNPCHTRGHRTGLEQWKVQESEKQALANLPFDGFYGTGCISLTVLVTVPFDTLISPLLPSAAEGCGAGNADEGDEDDGRRFHAF
ncbi:hypothetical protein OPV22_007360 [Ensete ventricosum]|uniref:Uncharacterized protein n=1 Tax=Ensete ventricosum TaxID=4639 RepID=A0AAV8RRL3_ENSVE|nr:hypothetical protein OPV22_007360 [Ensete ventricosum]